MTANSDVRWARAVRVLALISAVLMTVALLEARALRAARAEIQRLRTACTQGAFP